MTAPLVPAPPASSRPQPSSTWTPPQQPSSSGQVPPAPAPSAPEGGRTGAWLSRFVLGARFVALVYLFMVVFLLLATLVPVIAGWQPMAVISGSMQPAVQTGSVVLIEPAEADQYYTDPTILAYDDPARPGSMVTHRVIDTAIDDSGTVTYTTKGDANEVADSTPIAHENVTGAVRMVVPFLGLPAAWLANGQLLALAASVGLTLMALASLVVRVRP